MKAKPCKFNPNEYGYIQAQNMAKPYRQKRCLQCGLWTVYVHRKIPYAFSLCEGRDAVIVHLKNVRKELERAKALALPKAPKKRRSA